MDAGTKLRAPTDAPSASTPPKRGSTRRKLLSRAAVMSSATVAWSALRPARAAPAPFSPTHWLVQRITMGLDPSEVALADSLGYQGYLEYHLNYTAIDDSALDQRLASYQTLPMSPYQLYVSGISGNQIMNELIEATILRSILSKRQLFQRMVEFWTDHFNIDIFRTTQTLLKPTDDRDVIRVHALNTFPALLSASAHSLAMLQYLDNAASVAGNPNENYARELLELHTLSVNGGYTQTDVREVARCLTGWGGYWDWAQSNAGTFRFNASNHDNNSKVVLGQTIPAGGGINDGETVLSILSNHASTRQFIARKLCKWFYSYDPPQSLVDSVAQSYASTGGDIKAMIRTLFNSIDPAAAPPKYKRPYHLFASALRATATSVTTTSGLQTQLTAAGQMPFYWSPPDGYPDTLDAWVGLILPRWNFGASLTNSQISGASLNIDTFLQGANTADSVLDRIDAGLFGGAMPSSDRSRIRSYLLPDPPTAQRKQEAVGLAIGSPGYQWY